MKEKIVHDSKKKDFILICFFVLVALALRLVSLYFYHFIGIDGGVDGVAYAMSGKNFFSGLGYTYLGEPQLIQPPVYPLLIGFIWYLIHNLEFAGQIVSVIGGGLLVLPVFLLAQNMFGRKAALWSSLFISICPPLIFGSTEIRVVSLYTFLFIMMVYIGWKALRSTKCSWSALAGLMIGLCYLTRVEAFLFFPLYIFLTILFSKDNTSHFLTKIKHISLKVLLLIFVFIVTAAPYWIFLRHHTGKWMISGRTPYTFHGYYAGEWEKANFEICAYHDEILTKWFEKGGTSGFLLKNYKKLFSRIKTNLSVLWSGKDKQAQMLNIPPWAVKASLIFLFVIVAAGTWWAILFSKVRAKHVYLTIILSTCFIYFLFGIDWRYFYPYIPILIIGLGCIIDKICLLGKRSHSRTVKIIVYTLVIFSVLSMSTTSALLIGKKLDFAPYEYKMMGQWMRKNIPDIEHKSVMARKFGVPFYAGAKEEALFYGDYVGVLTYAKLKKIDYLIIDEWTIPNYRPRLAFLLDEKKKHPGLDYIHLITYKNRKIILYSISSE